MIGILRRLFRLPKDWQKALLASPEDPRDRFGTADQRHQGLPRRLRPDLKHMREFLHGEFSKVNSDTGLKVLQELVYEYAQLQPVLSRRKETDPLSVAHIPALAEETYRQGLSVLEDALELTRAIYLPDVQKLEAEVIRLEREMEALSRDGTQTARIKMREETLASHRELLDMVQQQQLRVDELLHQSDRCQASLHRTRIELAALRADGSDASVSAVTETLRRTINHAREVQEEMKRLGF